MRHALSKARIRAVVFDFDGTLAVPTLDFEAMRDRAREALYTSIPKGFSGNGTRSIGPGAEHESEPIMEELARVCAAVAECDPDTARVAREKALQAIVDVEMEAAVRSSLFDFVRPMLKALAEQNVVCGIITRNCREAVTTVFPDIAEHIPCVLTRDDVTAIKPDPAHLLEAVEALGTQPNTTLMVGDHPLDIITGKRARTLTAGVASGNTPLAALVTEKPDLLAKDVGALMRWLNFM